MGRIRIGEMASHPRSQGQYSADPRRTRKTLPSRLRRQPSVRMQYGHYSVLKVQPTATQEEITSSYRTLALLHHPDKCTVLPNKNQLRLRK